VNALSKIRMSALFILFSLLAHGQDDPAAFKTPPSADVMPGGSWRRPSRDGMGCGICAELGSPTLLRRPAPGACKVMENAPCSSRSSAFLRPSVGSSSHVSHTMALAALAGVGKGQGVFESKHSQAIANRGEHHDQVHCSRAHYNKAQHLPGRYRPDP